MKVGSVAASVAMPAAGALKGMMTKSLGGLAGKGLGAAGKGIGRASAMNQAKREQTKEWESAGYSKDEIKEMRKRGSVHRTSLKVDQKARADQIQEQRKYSRFTKDLEQREKINI